MTLLSVALLALFAASGWWIIGGDAAFGSRLYGVIVMYGRVHLMEWQVPDARLRMAPNIGAQRLPNKSPDFNLDSSFKLTVGGYAGRALYLPLLPLLLAALVPTALLWWLDRRKYPPGHCGKCGYDLTANVSGVCPECGSPIPEA